MSNSIISIQDKDGGKIKLTALNYRGIRKVNENIVRNGRALVITSKDINDYNWLDIPDGSLYVDSNTGEIKIKLEGESDWVPYNQKMDGTICIAKDSMIINEVFTIISIDDGNDNDGNPLNTFTYEDENGEYHHGQKTQEGYYVFELKKGSYPMYRNFLKVTIDDCLMRTPASGGVIEINENRFAVTDELEVDMELTVEYIRVFRIGNPYPRIFVHNDEPQASEIGDLWIDTDGTFAEQDALGENVEVSTTISWDRITGKPTTIKGYKITDNLSYVGHPHYKKDILDFPKAMPANGGDADTVDSYHAGINPNQVLVIQPNGKIHIDNLCSHQHDAGDINNLQVFIRGMIIDWYGSAANVPSGWHICDGTNGTPDLRDKFTMGAGSSYGLGATGGEASHVLTVSEMPSHSHEFPGDDHISNAFGLTRNSEWWNWDWTSGSTGSCANGWYNTRNSGGNAAHNNIPPFVALYKIMKL